MSDDVVLAVLEDIGVLVGSQEAVPFESSGTGTDEPLSTGELDGDHRLFDHVPAWDFEDPRFERPFAGNETALFEHLPAETPKEELTEHTRLIVLFGAEDTESFRHFLRDPKAVVVLLEPDPARLAKLAGIHRPATLAEGNLYAFVGNVFAGSVALHDLVPNALFQVGYPVFLVHDRVKLSHPEYVRRLVEYFEILYYRYRIYPVSGQFNMRGLPLRSIERGLFYDQQFHAYENISEYARSGNVALLGGACRGETAILIAAGPDLENRIEYLRANRDRAVLIAVNNAMTTLLAHDLEPHFMVVNDGSLAVRDGMVCLPRLRRTVLVGHRLSFLGGDRFPKKFVFGSHLPEVFGERSSLRLHGSVVTTAFSLARHLGCTRAVLVGAQLSGDDPWSFSYAKRACTSLPSFEARPLTNKHPQYYPVRTPFGETRYTSLNFRDACLWFLEEIRTSGIECVNTTRESIIYGPGVRYERDFEVPETGNLAACMRSVYAASPSPLKWDLVRGYIDEELARWRNTAGPLATLLAKPDEEFKAFAPGVLEQCDRSGISYLVQRFEDFDHWRFYTMIHDPEDETVRLEGLRYCFDYARRMAETFVEVLQMQRCELFGE